MNTYSSTVQSEYHFTYLNLLGNQILFIILGDKPVLI